MARRIAAVVEASNRVADHADAAVRVAPAGRRRAHRHTAESIAAGCIRVAVENMANAIKKISVQRGHDVTEYTLVCFGGAAGQHACLVADALGMQTVYIHPLAGVLSAYGIGLADVTSMKQQAVEAELRDDVLADLQPAFATLETAAREALLTQGVPLERIRVERKLAIKYAGTDSTLQLSPSANLPAPPSAHGPSNLAGSASKGGAERPRPSRRAKMSHAPPAIASGSPSEEAGSGASTPGRTDSPAA